MNHFDAKKYETSLLCHTVYLVAREYPETPIRERVQMMKDARKSGGSIVVDDCGNRFIFSQEALRQVPDGCIPTVGHGKLWRPDQQTPEREILRDRQGRSWSGSVRDRYFAYERVERAAL